MRNAWKHKRQQTLDCLSMIATLQTVKLSSCNILQAVKEEKSAGAVKSTRQTVIVKGWSRQQ